MSIPPILPLLETKFLTTKELAIRWHTYYPNIFNSYDTALSHVLINLKTSGGLTGIEQTRSSYNYARDTHKTIKTGGILISGAEINRFEEEYFNKNNLPQTEKDDLPLKEYLEHPNYPTELDIANQAWFAVAIKGLGEGNTPKLRLINWLENSGYGLDKTTIERIAKVCNYDKNPGRRYIF